MELNEVLISQSIIEAYFKEMLDYLNTDVSVVGAGPSGMVAAYYLAQKGYKVAIFEKKLNPGGGMWGGGMMFNKIVVQEKGKEILDEFQINYQQSKPGYYVADSIETTSTLISKTTQAGAKFFNLITVEDVMIHNERVDGLVLNWAPVQSNKLMVDPLVIKAKFVIDGTGHPAELLQIMSQKMKIELETPTKGIPGEKSMNAMEGEKDVVENTKEVYPGIYVIGMAANAAFGSHRMGPIFGGMLSSGKRAAELISQRLTKSK